MTNKTIYPENASIKTIKFINKAIIKHGNKYDYSLVEYIHSRENVIIICPIHGLIPQTPDRHLYSFGCSFCGIESRTKSRTPSKEEFIDKAIIKHGNKYDYSLVEYVNGKTNVIIICPTHGPFMQVSRTHLAGHGCQSCGGKIQSTKEEFIDKAIIKHGNKYDYSLVEYVNGKTNVTILCPCPCGYSFLQRPDKHLAGHGCQSCAKTGFDKTKPSICYYIKFQTETQILYKIGITNTTVKRRLCGMGINKGTKITIIQELYFNSGLDALNLETKILQEFKSFQYKNDPIMNNGNSELFIKDVLLLDS